MFRFGDSCVDLEGAKYFLNGTQVGAIAHARWSADSQFLHAGMVGFISYGSVCAEMSRDKTSERSVTSDRSNDGGNGAGSGSALREQAAAILCSTEANDIIRGMNASTDMIRGALDQNKHSTDLFDALKDRDESQAMDFAVHSPEIQTHALHDTGDEEFQQDLRLRLTGTVDS